MIKGLRVVVVMPAYNAERTLKKCYESLPHEIVDEVVLVDDASGDRTVDVALDIGVHTVIRHDRNLGYGGNQKTCYSVALEHGADIVVMIHPDYQYAPTLCGAMAWMVASGEYDVVLGSRIVGNSALRNGMPVWKYVANRVLTAIENLILNAKLSEYHTGYRAFRREVLLSLPLAENSNDFAFDNEMLVQAIRFGFRIGELSCPARYAPDSSSISFRRSVRYGFGVLAAALSYRLDMMGVRRARFLSREGRTLADVPIEGRRHSAGGGGTAGGPQAPGPGL
jgi:glycosyltransferase involved in cell wall biosynthesis